MIVIIIHVIGRAHGVFFLVPFIKFIVTSDVVYLHSVLSALQNLNRVKFNNPCVLLFSLHAATSQLTVVFPNTFMKVVCHLSE